MQWARTAICDQNIIGRVIALFDGNNTYSTRHIGVDNADYALCCLVGGHMHRIGDFSLDGLSGELRIDFEPAA
ncbi:hypothetical protein SDC9_153887 [bioreactor metagenome]|uniref:Uncharacterized protein n=1 Tax=bioreactor metagenome TaxID=1076179 RepID=A0A645EX94_9ZZZZ